MQSNLVWTRPTKNYGITDKHDTECENEYGMRFYTIIYLDYRLLEADIYSLNVIAFENILHQNDQKGQCTRRKEKVPKKSN